MCAIASLSASDCTPCFSLPYAAVRIGFHFCLDFLDYYECAVSLLGVFSTRPQTCCSSSSASVYADQLLDIVFNIFFNIYVYADNRFGACFDRQGSVVLVFYTFVLTPSV